MSRDYKKKLTDRGIQSVQARISGIRYISVKKLSCEKDELTGT